MTKTSTYMLLALMLSAALLQPIALPTMAQPTTKGVITGMVYDSLTGDAIAYARVELRLSNESWMWFNDTWTNWAGEYSIEVPPGTYHVLADKWPNYTSPYVEKFVEVEAGSTVYVDLFLWPTGRVNGTVAYEGVTSDQGADLLFVNKTSGNAVARKYAGVWDGGYTVDVPVGDYDVLAFGWGYGPGRMTDEVSSVPVLKGEETTVDVDLQGSGMEVWVHTYGWKWEYMPGTTMTCIVEVQNTTNWEPVSNASIALYFFGPVDWPHSEPYAYSTSFDDLREIKSGIYITRVEIPSGLSPGGYNLVAAVRKDGRLGLGDMWFSIIQYRLDWCYAKSVYSPSEDLSFRFTVDNGLEYVTDLDISYTIVEQHDGTNWVWNVLESGKAVYDESLQEYKAKAEGVTLAKGHKYKVSLSVGQNTYDWWFESGDLDVTFIALSKYPIHIELGFRNTPPFIFTCDEEFTLMGKTSWATEMSLPVADVDWIHIYYDDVSTPAMDIFETWDIGPNATELLDLHGSFVSFTAIPAGEIRGIIRDDNTGEPLGDVEITGVPIKYGEIARWAYARSDWDGSYRLPVVTGREYLLKFFSRLYETYKTDNETYGFLVPEAGGVATVDVNLTKVPTGILTGVVFWDVDADGVYNSSVDKLLSDTWIGLHDYSWNWLGGVTTGDNGRYTFTVRADTFLRIMTWLNETFRSRPLGGISVAEGETLRLDIPMERAITIRGRVEGPGWFDCLLLDRDYNIVERIGESGGWDFQWTVPGSVKTLLFRTWGDYYPVEYEVYIGDFNDTQDYLSLPPITMNTTTLDTWSYMKDWEWERQPGDSVKFYVEAMNRSGDWSQRSVERAEVSYKLWDSTGQFLSSGTGIYKDGRYIVNVSIPMKAKPGPVELIFMVENATLDYYGVCGDWFHITTLKIVTLKEVTPYSTEESPSFAWLVLNASKLPAKNVHIEYELFSTSGDWEQIAGGEIKGSSTGVYNVTLPPQPEGSYELHVVFGKQFDRWMWFDVVENLTRVRVYGHVSDKSGNPVEMAVLDFSGGMEYWTHYVTMTNASGYYEAFLPKGGYGVHVTRGSMRTLPEWLWIEIPPRVFDFTLYEVGFLEGRVIDPPLGQEAEESFWYSTTINVTLISTNLWDASTPDQHLPPSGTTSYLPGVEVGDEANYTVTFLTESNDPYATDEYGYSETITFSVIDVEGSNVTLLCKDYDENGTLWDEWTYWIDVETGEMSDQEGLPLVIAANLTAGDPLFNITGVPAIEETVEKRFCMHARMRLVNMLHDNTTEGSGTFAWDRSTGIICEVIMLYNETFTPEPGPGPEPGPEPGEGYEIGSQVIFWNATTGKLVTMEWVWGYFILSSPTGTYDITFMDWGLTPHTEYNVTIEADEMTDIGDIKLYQIDWRNELWAPCDPWETTPGKNVTVEIDLSVDNWELELTESITGLEEGNFSIYLIGWRWPQPPMGYEKVQLTVEEDPEGFYTLNITIPEDAEAGCWDGRLVISTSNETYLVSFSFNIVTLYVGATPQKRLFYPEETIYLVTIVTTPDNTQVTGLEDVDFRIQIFGPYGEVSANFTAGFYELGHGVYLMEFPIPNGTTAGGYSIDVMVTAPGIGSARDWQWFEIAGKKEEYEPGPGPGPEPPPPEEERPPLVVAANLTAGDTLFDIPEAPTIDETVEEFFAGTTRLVNYLYMDEYSPDFEEYWTVGWDRSTGLLCTVIHEVNKTSPEGYAYIFTNLTLTWTSLWDESTPPQSLPTTEETDYMPGVYAGDMTDYDFTVSWESTDPYFFYDGPESGTVSIEIIDVFDSTVKIHLTQYEADTGDKYEEDFEIDMKTGEFFHY